MKSNNKHYCKRCLNEIKENERTVLLKTYDNKEVYEELYWHLKCWSLDFNERAGKKAMEFYNNSMNFAVKNLSNLFNNGKESNKSIVLQKGSS